MPRRKKKFMLLRNTRNDTLIVVSRDWYDHTNTISKNMSFRYDRGWKIVTQSDDEEMLIHMANLTDKYVGMAVKHTHEDAEGNITNVRVRDAASRWELNNDQPSREG